MLKNYTSKSDISLSVPMVSGSSVRVSFSPVTGGGSVFYTEDEELQAAMEKHAKFGKLFKEEEVPEETEEEAMADAGAEVQEEVTFEADCTNDVKDYLCERFGASRTKLRTRAACDEFAKAHGVKIVYKD